MRKVTRIITSQITNLVEVQKNKSVLGMVSLKRDSIFMVRMVTNPNTFGLNNNIQVKGLIIVNQRIMNT